jgi:hypothetical protein
LESSRSLRSVAMSPNTFRALRLSGTTTTETPCTVLRASVRTDVRVMSITPPRNSAESNTMAPASASNPRVGSPTSAPIQPPERSTVSRLMSSGRRTTCNTPRMARAVSPHPMASRKR